MRHAIRTGGDLRYNLLALGTDYACFRVGQSFASESTILPVCFLAAAGWMAL